MRVGLIDLDRKNESKPFPNIPLMKLSAWHKQKGDDVSWYDGSYCDIVYMSKVFSFTEDYKGEINAGKIVRGGGGFAITVGDDGKERFDKSKCESLPYEVEHIYPDYSIYGITDTAYGFMSRGCPRNCHFCHVSEMPLDGTKSRKVADLSEFWNWQKYIQLCDPNTFACKDWKDILQQLIDSGSYVDFNQGVDIRILNEERIDMLKQVKMKHIHFAFDRIQDWDIATRNLKLFKNMTGYGRNKVSVYILTNFDTNIEDDVKRVEFVRSLNFNPYVMVYNKKDVKRGSEINKLARWVNNKALFWGIESFEEYKRLTKLGLTYGRK